FKKAAQWFRRAANKGHAGAQYNLGIMSYLGQGMDQDYAQAAHWFHKAGEQDHAAAQYNLGFLYYEGKGVEKDSLQAFMWIDRSANLGDEKAIRARDTLQKALPREIFNR
ncbi:MAG: sel1 repeat family protein, partial [Rhodospirillales bacterium]|nr:sel1 repeat family protein [Rhodospirillales bacterium]